MPRTAAPPALTQSIEDYLKVAFKLSSRGGKATVSGMAKRLGVSAPSVTSMVKKMKTMGLVEQSPYAALTLTAKGARIALEIIRHHRLWELYLTKRLGLPLHEVDAEAERLEHVMSDAVEDRMVKLLGDPGEDPHGDPIPTKSGVLKSGPDGRKLSELRQGEKAVVAHISDRNPDYLKTMADAGLLPGTRLTLVKHAGATELELRIGTRKRLLSKSVADLVRVV